MEDLLNFETYNMSDHGSRLPPEEVPLNQSSMLCNDQAGQNMLVENNDSIQQTTQFPPSFPQTMMEGAPPSSVEDDVNFTLSQLELDTLMSELSWSPAEEVPVNQSSMLCNDQAGQNMLVDNNDSIQQTTQFPTSFPQTMTAMRGLDGTLSSWINQNGPNWPQTPSSDQQWTNQLPMSNQVSGMLPQPQPPMIHCSRHFPYQFNQVLITPNPYDPQSSTMLPESSQSLRFPQFPPRNLQVSGDHNQGQVDQAYVIPHIDNIQQENLVPRNFGRSTRSQMENPQVHVLQNHTARPNASNPGPDSSLQSQNRGLNTQQDKMVRSNDPFWNDVEEMNDGRLKCKFCRHVFAKDTSISRIKWHLSGETGHGVCICGQVPKEVQEAAFLAMHRGNKRHKSISSSSNVNDLAVDAGRMQVGVQDMEQGWRERIHSHVDMENTGEGSFQHVDRIVSRWILGVDAHENRGEAAQGTDLEDQFAGGRMLSEVQKLNEITTYLMQEAERLRGAFETIPRTVQVQLGGGSRSSESLKYNKSRGVPFTTSSNKPVGQAFEENRKVIWSLLTDDEVSTICIYGMGGVGKTTLLQHIYNELLQRPDICDHIWWVTVSQDFNINKLQNLIAKRLELDLSSEHDDHHRAAKLSEELRKKQKWILILDDLWNSFELQDVGIHCLLKRCKLILMTRSQMVCDQIDCQHKIQVKPLSEGESWILFKENLGSHIALSDEVEGIAKVVARECDGLPLGIITVAGSLRGVDDPHEWRDTLKKLKDSEIWDMEVFKLLRFSYDRLGDSALQQCLLYCALFPEDHMIEKQGLIGYLIDEGIIKGRRRQDAFDEGHTMLNRLQYVCLLENVHSVYDDRRYVKMHDLIRDMAIQILQGNSQVIVKAGAQLVELPDPEEWTEDLTRVSLMENRFKVISSSHSPMCPNLSTLLLCQNHWLVFIADSFFKPLHGLKVLDLSHTSVKNLPESVSDLVCLTALLLINCERLRYVPSLEKLRALESLDLYGTSLEKMPQGMECLSNLRYFRINVCGEKEFPSGILPRLSHLQVLALGCYTVEGKEVGGLLELETLQCHFKGFSDFVEYLTSRDGIQSLSTYKILVGTLTEIDWDECYVFPSKTVKLGNLSINRERDFQVRFLNGIQGLYCKCIDARSLCDVLSLENATELESIEIENSDSMESLVSSSWFCSATLPLPSHNGMFSRLKQLCCYNCSSLKKLFPLELLPYLVNLKVIDVIDCEKMEEIIGTTDEESSTLNPIAELTLPKLTSLYLTDLPELKEICRAKLICNSLEVISVTACENLKRIPISLPLLENGQPSLHPSLKKILAGPVEWWETVVEWESPNAKDGLLPIIHFC